MNNFQSFRQRALDKWALLAENEAPVIYLGTASCGRAAGAMEVLKTIEQVLAENKLSARIVQVGCIGPCYLEPLMDIKLPGKPRISYANVSPDKASKIVKALLVNDDLMAKSALGHFGDEAFTAASGIDSFYNHPMLKPQVRVVLRNCGLIDPEEIDHYLANDGYLGLMKAFAMSPEEVIDTVKAAGMRGRGGAGFSTGLKWELARKSPGDVKYVICNADEGDPGAFMNRSLIEGDPHAVLEGLLIAGYAVGAKHGYIYARAEYPLAIAHLKTAIAQMREYGLLGKNIQGSGFDFEVTIKEGAGAYVCGEETALIASIEGKRGMPTTRPPFPTTSGLYGKPTSINNVETLGTVASILRNGPEWYKQFGLDGNCGTKTFSLVGKVRRSGLIEVPLGMTLRQIIFDIGGGTRRRFKAVQTGGPSGGCLCEEHLDTPVNYESLQAAGSIMGSGGLIVLDDNSCVVDLARYFLDFSRREVCGKCSPCRIGTRLLVETLEKITRGEGELEDLDKLERIAATVVNGSLCGAGQNAPNPILTTLRYFREEYLTHINEKFCPAAVCNDLFELRILEDQCTGCRVCQKSCPTGAITGELKQAHHLDTLLCIKCRACIEACRFDAIVGVPIPVPSNQFAVAG